MRNFICLLLVLSTSIGCEKADIAHSSKADSDSKTLSKIHELSFKHSFGKVHSGVLATHTFQFENKTGETLILDVTTPAKKSCGCTSYKIDKKSLSPSEIAHVELGVDTSLKDGPFSEKVSIGWISSSDAKYINHFEIAGESISAFRSQPGLVFFTREDVVNETVKKVTITSDLPIAWNTFSCDSTNIAITCTPLTNSTPKNSRILEIRIIRNNLRGAVIADLRLKGKVQKSLEDGTEFYSGSFKVSVADVSPLRVTPKIVYMKSGKLPNMYEGACMLTGQSNRDLSDINFVTDASVELKISQFQKIASTVSKIKFTVTPQSEDPLSVLREFNAKLDVDELDSQEIKIVLPVPKL